MQRRRVPEEVFAYEEEVEEVGVSETDDPEPRDDEQEEEQDARKGQRVTRYPEIPRRDHEAEDHRSGQHDPDEALAQRRKRHSGVKKQIEPPVAGRVSEIEPSEGDGQEERERHIRDVEVRRGVEEQGSGQDQSGKKGAPDVSGAGCEEGRQENPADSQGGRPEAARPFVLPEDREGRGGQPVVQDGLLEILDVVQAGRDEIPRLKHFSRNFRVSPLVRLQQPVSPEGGEVENPGDEGQDDCNTLH